FAARSILHPSVSDRESRETVARRPSDRLSLRNADDCCDSRNHAADSEGRFALAQLDLLVLHDPLLHVRRHTSSARILLHSAWHNLLPGHSVHVLAAAYLLHLQSQHRRVGNE
ncbi:hypothetical protein PMAYCL1PPCAC_04529, partial [Pristionchus mayeri]